MRRALLLTVLVLLASLLSLGWVKGQRSQTLPTGATDADLAAVLAGKPALRRLDLSASRVTDAGLRHLTGLTALERL